MLRLLALASTVLLATAATVIAAPAPQLAIAPAKPHVDDDIVVAFTAPRDLKSGNNV
jgi:hypothetical protein